jgi:hypothetical protein
MVWDGPAVEVGMRGTRNTRGLLGGILFFLGAILLIVSLLSVWYVFSSSASESIAGNSISGTGQLELKTGSDYTVTFSYSCSGAIASSVCPGSSSYTCPYSGGGSGSCNGTRAENDTGRLYAVTEYLVLGGLILGLVGGLLALLSPGRPGLRKGAMALGILALLFALIAPMTLLALQPGAIKSDETSPGGSAPNGTGPYSSFFGSCSGSTGGCESYGGTGFGGNSSSSWGPSTGWYLSIGAFVLFLIGLILFLGGRGGVAAASAGAPATPDRSTSAGSSEGPSPTGPAPP